MHAIVLMLMIVAGLAAANPVNISIYIADSTGNGIVLDSEDVTFSLYDRKTTGNKVFEEVQKIKTNNGVVQARIGEAVQLPANIPDSLFLEIEYRAKKLTRYRIGTAIYAIKAKNAKRVGGLDTSQIAYRSHTHDSTNCGDITFVDSTETAINAMHLQGQSLSDLDARFAAKQHSHTTTTTITRIDSSGHAEIADSAGKAGNARLFNGLTTADLSMTNHNHDSAYAMVSHTHGTGGQTIQKVDSSTYTDTAKYAGHAKTADTAAVAIAVVNKVAAAEHGDTALYAMSVRPFKQDSTRHADTAQVARQLIGKAAAAARADTADVALYAVAGFKADSAIYADTAAYAEDIVGKAAAAGHADTAQVALGTVAGYKADSTGRADTATYALNVRGKVDSAGRADTAGYATRTGQTRIDSAGHVDTANVSRRTLQTRIDSTYYADTARYARNYLFNRVDSATYADTATYAATGRRADTATYFGSRRITEFALVGHLHPQDTMDLKARGFVSVCSLGCDYDLVDSAVAYANSRSPTETNPMVVYVKTTRSNKLNITSADFVYFKGENPGIEIELQGTAKFGKTVISDMQIKTNHNITNTGNVVWELRNCRLDMSGGTYSIDTLVCVNTEIYTTNTTASLSGDYLRAMSCRFNNRGGGSPTLSMNWAKAIVMGSDFDIAVSSTGTSEHYMNCRFNTGDFVAPAGGIVQSCWVNSLKSKVAPKYFNNIIKVSACNTGESGSPAVWVGNIADDGSAIGVPSCP